MPERGRNTILPALRIARVIARLNVGGPAVQAILMTKALRDLGHETWLFAGNVPEGEQSAEYLAEERGVAVNKVNGLSRNISLTQDWRSLGSLRKAFCRIRPDVVHTHTAKAGVLGRVAAIIAGVPIRVHTFHGNVFEGYFPRWLSRLFVTIEKLLACFTDRIIAISESQRRDLVYKYKIAPANKVACIPLGFDIDPYLALPLHAQGSLRSELGLSGEHLLVGWVGRLTEIKNPLAFIEVARIITERYQEARFLIVGDGKLRLKVEEAIRAHKLSGRVFVYGVCRDLRRVYADIDLLVLTSRNEGTPLAMLEAMASARPVVGTDVGGVKDLMVGRGAPCSAGMRFDNGILTLPDQQRLSEAIGFYLSNPVERRDAGAAGREWVRRRYSYTRLADDLGALYSEIALQKGLRSSSSSRFVGQKPAKDIAVLVNKT